MKMAASVMANEFVGHEKKIEIPDPLNARGSAARKSKTAQSVRRQDLIVQG
jgi:hypothetical protein